VSGAGRLLARDLSAVLEALSQGAGGAVLRAGDRTVVWEGGELPGAAAEIVFDTGAGPLSLSVPAAARAQAEVAAAALRQLVANRRAIDDLSVTARRLWAEQNLLFGAGEVLRQDLGESDVVSWLAERLATVRTRASAVARWDGRQLEVAGGLLPPGRQVGDRVPGSPRQLRVLDSGESESFIADGEDSGRDALLPLGAGQPGLLVPLLAADRILGVAALGREAGGAPFSAEEVKLAQLLADVAAVALANRLLIAEAEYSAALQRELALAADIQRMLLPPTEALYDRLEIAAACRPVARVGGDGYIHRRLPDGRVLLGVVDIAGHGMPASLALAAFLARVDTLTELEPGLGALLATLNRQMAAYEQVALRLATAAIVIVDPAGGGFEAVRAGHPPVLVVRRRGEVEPLLDGGLPLGISPETRYPVEQGRLEGGDAVLLYSDGISEARSPAGEPFGWERLVELTGSGHERAASLLSCVLEGVQAFAGGETALDDQTLLVARRLEVARG
jgi:serine phosphatase RsbU (regulator of sigma subunit)